MIFYFSLYFTEPRFLYFYMFLLGFPTLLVNKPWCGIGGIFIFNFTTFSIILNLKFTIKYISWNAQCKERSDGIFNESFYFVGSFCLFYFQICSTILSILCNLFVAIFCSFDGTIHLIRTANLHIDKIREKLMKNFFHLVKNTTKIKALILNNYYGNFLWEVSLKSDRKRVKKTITTQLIRMVKFKM